LVPVRIGRFGFGGVGKAAGPVGVGVQTMSGISAIGFDRSVARRSRCDNAFARPGGAPFSERLRTLIGHPDLDALLERNRSAAAALEREVRVLADRAFRARDADALYEAQSGLYLLYEDHLRPFGHSAGLNQFNPFLLTIRNVLERGWETYERARLSVDSDAVPADPEAFRERFRSLCGGHRMVGHPLFAFLENDASRADLIAFFLSDGAVIIRFCDLVILSMVGIDDEIRPELAENFWDEMGRGRFQERHVQLYRDLLEYTGVNLPAGTLDTEHFIDHLRWQGLAGYNLYLFLCLHRRNQFRALGALGAAEMMDPPQYAAVVRGCRRVGLDDAAGLAYYAGHQEMDVAHGDQWLDNVLIPLVRKFPDKRHEIVVGAEMRMNITLDYYDELYARFAGGAAGGPS
jgi:Iron-containing redox enzyme